MVGLPSVALLLGQGSVVDVRERLRRYFFKCKKCWFSVLMVLEEKQIQVCISLYIYRERNKLYHYPCSLYVLFSHIIIKKIKMNIMWPLGVPAPWALLGVLSSCQLRWSRNWPVCSCWYLLKLDFHLHCFGLSDPKLASFNSGLRPQAFIEMNLGCPTVVPIHDELVKVWSVRSLSLRRAAGALLNCELLKESVG